MKQVTYLNLIFLFFILLSFIFYINQNLFAQTAPSTLEEQIKLNLNQTGEKSAYGEVVEAYATETYIGVTIGLIISYVLGFIGVIFLIITIYSGFQWMTAGGNEETITKAKKRIINSVIGLIIIFTAYLITYFITEVLITTTDYEPPV